MKKVIILGVLCSIFYCPEVLSFSFYYEYLREVNQQNFIILLRGPQGEKKFICRFADLECKEENLNFSLKPKIFSNYLLSNNYQDTIVQIKISPQKFITLYSPHNNSIFEILDFDKKINNFFIDEKKEKIIFQSDKDFHLFSLKNKKIIDQFNLDNQLYYLTLSPSLRYLAFYENGRLENSYRKFFIFDIQNKKLKEFFHEKLDYWDLLIENNKIFEFIDDNRLLFLSDHENYQTLYMYNLQTEKVERIFSENFLIKDFLVFRNKIFFTANKENPLKWDLYGYDIKSRELKKLVDYVVYDTDLVLINNYLIFRRGSDTPPQVYLLDLISYKIERPKISYEVKKIKVGEARNFKNLWAVILKPDNFVQDKENDLIIWLHGGPYRQASLGFHPYESYGVYDFILEKLRKAGFLIIKLDYLGSFGYGRNFAESLKENIGKDDIRGIIDVINDITKEIKIGKIYLLGNSYGGYLSLKTIYEFPNLFNGAISINGVTDWRSLIRNYPSSIFRIHFDGPPTKKNNPLYDQADLFLEKEKLNNKNILIIYGNQDKTVPPWQQKIFIEEYKDVAKMIYQELNEGHIIKSRESLEKILLLILTFTKI